VKRSGIETSTFKVVLIFCFGLFSFPISLFAQEENDSILSQTRETDTRFTVKQLIVPASLITIGTLGVYTKPMQSVNEDIEREMSSHRSHSIGADDYLQYLPAVSFYGLSLAGAKAKHNYVDRTLILATSYLSMNIMVGGVKYTVHSRRPHSDEDDSFPSGHAAKAFLGAELVRREYGDDSPWYGIAAYSVATGVGLLRIYNGEHWATDVIAGAGFGILSAQIGYWLLPFNQKLFHCNQTGTSSLAIAPYFTGNHGGIGLSYRF
jgi:hypothetical protein